jgi:hypothetical protein
MTDSALHRESRRCAALREVGMELGVVAEYLEPEEGIQGGHRSALSGVREMAYLYRRAASGTPKSCGAGQL